MSGVPPPLRDEKSSSRHVTNKDAVHVEAVSGKQNVLGKAQGARHARRARQRRCLESATSKGGMNSVHFSWKVLEATPLLLMILRGIPNKDGRTIGARGSLPSNSHRHTHGQQAACVPVGHSVQFAPTLPSLCLNKNTQQPLGRDLANCTQSAPSRSSPPLV